jgi:hypothetical protein
MVAPPPAARQRLRIVLSFIAFMLFLSLVALAPTASASVSSVNVKQPDLKKCIEVHEDYDLRNMARDSNVFLIVHHKDDSDKRVDLCNKFESTPDRIGRRLLKRGKHQSSHTWPLEVDMKMRMVIGMMVVQALQRIRWEWWVIRPSFI